MDKNIEKFQKLNDLVALAFRKKQILVLNPEEDNDRKDIDDDIIWDKAQWRIPEEMEEYIQELSKNDELCVEDKILTVFERICQNYIYDDNVISYIKKVDDDTFEVPDWYGRETDLEWEKNREGHNRRVCYELSRYLAKSLMELLKDNSNYNVCIYWDKDLTHYFVGLTCDDYSITLDPDNFSNIKDLTRLKTGLTAEGIKILEDKDDKFYQALKKFNKGRNEHAIKKMEDDIVKSNNTLSQSTQNQDSTQMDENSELTFLRKSFEILVQKHELDSQGIFEYMKEIVDITLGSDEREKIWKRIDGNSKESTRYIRCLIVTVDDKKFLIDVDEKVFRPFDEEELNLKRTTFIPFKELSRTKYDYYDGR